MEKHKIIDVFTPTRPARASFVERDSVNEKLVNALETPGKQIVVYGHSGSGKTTLVENKLCQLYVEHLTTRCISGMTFDQILRDAFDQLDKYYRHGAKTKTSTSISSTISGEYLGIKAKMEMCGGKEKEVEDRRVVPPELTPQRLGQYIGVAGCCWVLEDFHKIGKDQKTILSQAMKVFMDMADNWPLLKIIAIGAVDTARQVVEYDPEMRNRVAEIEVPLMSPNELREILAKGEELLNIQIFPDGKREIILLSNGLASVCHSLGLNACRAVNLVETTDAKVSIGQEAIKDALRVYMEDSGDSLKGLFDKAFYRKKNGKFDNFRIVIEGLAKLSQEGGNHGEIYDCILDKEPDYPKSNLKYCLKQLQEEERGELVRYDDNSGKYSFSSPFYRAFALAYFSNDTGKDFLVRDSHTPTSSLVLKKIATLLEEIIADRQKV